MGFRVVEDFRFIRSRGLRLLGAYQIQLLGISELLRQGGPQGLLGMLRD